MVKSYQTLLHNVNITSQTVFCRPQYDGKDCTGESNEMDTCKSTVSKFKFRGSEKNSTITLVHSRFLCFSDMYLIHWCPQGTVFYAGLYEDQTRPT